MAVVFDIETIPQQNELEEWQDKLLTARLTSEIKYQDLGILIQNAPDSLIHKTMALNPFLGQIVCIGLYFTRTGKEVGIIGDEKDIIEEFWERISDERQFISFNGLDFDVPFIILRSVVLGIEPPHVGTNTHPFVSRARFRRKPHFDVAGWASDWKNQYRLPLGSLCNALKVKSPKEGEIKAENVFQAYKDGRINEIRDYCLRDCKSTYDVAKIIINYVSNQL